MLSVASGERAWTDLGGVVLLLLVLADLRDLGSFDGGQSGLDDVGADLVPFSGV
jgi:hypothetical protein